MILEKYVTSLHTDLQCYEPIKRSVKNKAATDGRRAHCGIRRLFPQDDNEMFVTGSTLHAGEEVNPPPGHNPLGHADHALRTFRTLHDGGKRAYISCYICCDITLLLCNVVNFTAQYEDR